MTTPPMTMRRRFALHGENWLALAMLAVLFVFALAGAFTHMHDWTITAINEALRENALARGVTPVPVTPDWFGWSNAVTSEIMPTYALLTVRKRQRQGRSITGPGWLFGLSSLLSLLAQLSATGVRLPYDAQLLVCLPAIALVVLGTFKLSDMSFAREEAAAAEQAAERERRQAELAAERQRRQAELAAELAAEQAAERERAAAEQAAEAERQRAEREAELAREAAEREAERATALARIEAEQATERLRIEAAERDKVWAAEQERQRRADEAEAARLAEAARIEAEARAERDRAEAERIRAEAEKQAQAAALLAQQAAGRHAVADHGRGQAEVTEIGTGGRVYRPRHESEAIAAATLATLPKDTPRDQAVRNVAAALGTSRRQASKFVPQNWPASSAGGEESAA